MHPVFGAPAPIKSEPDLIRIASDALSAEINPLGAELHALRDAELRDLQWDGDAAFWTGRAPILFPIVGMLANDRYRVGGQTYRLPKHGFARRKLFEVLETTADHAVLRLSADEETLAVYPFRFELDVGFAVEAATLTLTAKVRNLDRTPMPASFGFHPALRWPLPFGRPRAEHRLTFAEDEPAPIRRIDTDGLLTPTPHPTPVEGQAMRLKDELFETDAVIFDQLRSHSVRLGAGEGPALEVRFPDTPYLGVWTKPGAPYICIEPWHGVADPQGYEGDFFDKPGVFVVDPGDEKVMALSISRV